MPDPRPALLLSLLLACGAGTDPTAAPAPAPPAVASALRPVFDGPDAARRRVAIRLEPLVEGVDQPTDIAFTRRVMLVAEKRGRLRWFAREGGAAGIALERSVRTRSEQGLLGIALHPDFDRNGRFFLHYVVEGGRAGRSRVQAFRVDPAAGFPGSAVQPGHVVLELDQPYANHNGGAIAFGPDGMLYVAFGDGGAGGDPLGSGQDPGTWLGAILRLDVDGARPYAVPPDNPLLGRPGAAPEVFAWGLRNPWRFSFAPDGRMVVADVGQNRWEELDIVLPGANLGWNVREGRACFRPPAGCPAEGLTDPFFVYGREAGRSVTGGHVATGPAAPSLAGRYVFGDFVSGRLWAIELPAEPAPERMPEPLALGRWPIMPSTFGRTPEGDLVVADFRGDRVLRIVEGPGPG